VELHLEKIDVEPTNEGKGKGLTEKKFWSLQGTEEVMTLSPINRWIRRKGERGDKKRISPRPSK